MSTDPEKGDEEDEFVGFADLAGFIASDKEQSTSIYRQCEKLAARNILYLQSELRALEVELEELDRDDGQDPEAMGSAMDWQLLCNRAKEPDNEKEKERLERILKVRVKMKEYQETVLRNAEMLRLQRPTRQVHSTFQGHFHNRDKKNPYPRLAGISADLYDDEFREDVVALAERPKDEDRLTTWLRTHFPRLFQRRKSNGSVGYLSEYRLNVFVGAVNVLLAACILFGAIYNLFYVKSAQKRLGLIAGYTTMFALCIGLLTNARRPEVFGACAAYAAVLAVFVSGNLGD